MSDQDEVLIQESKDRAELWSGVTIGVTLIVLFSLLCGTCAYNRKQENESERKCLETGGQVENPVFSNNYIKCRKACK